MFKKSLAVITALATLAVAVPALAETTGSTGIPPTTVTAESVTTKIACVGAAVAAREATLDTAMTTFNGAQNAAYAARAAALQQAYTQTTLAAVKTAVKAAWSAFRTTMSTARHGWQTARVGAWAAYRTTAVACKAPAGTGDGSNSSSEASGN